MRYKKNAAPNTSGVCGNSDGTQQSGWNIKWVASAAGSGGGSELADVGAWTTSEPLVQDLRVSTARAMYNHNDTRGVLFFMYAGADGDWRTSGILPGQDDGVEAYHSAGAVSGSSGGSYCNPSDWWCNDLTLGNAPAEGGRAKWTNHWVAFRRRRELQPLHGRALGRDRRRDARRCRRQRKVGWAAPPIKSEWTHRVRRPRGDTRHMICRPCGDSVVIHQLVERVGGGPPTLPAAIEPRAIILARHAIDMHTAHL